MLRSCIVGCGAISPLHANGIQQAPEGVLEAVCDIRPQRADALAARYGCRALYSFGDVLKDPRIDVVHVCTPHFLHADMTVRALRAGKHVLQEKPVAISRPDLESLLAATTETGGHLCICLQNRTNACIRAMAERIRTDSSLGKLTGVSGFLVWRRDEAYYAQDSWRGHWDTEGGSLMSNQAIHLIDLMHFFAGPARRVRAHIATKLLEGVIETEDTADALIEFENGVRGVFFGTNTYTSSSPITLELNFENATLRYVDQTLYIARRGEQAECLARDAAAEQGKSVWGRGHQQAIGDFYRFLSGNGKSYLSLADVLPSSKTLLALYESGKAGNVWTNV